MLKYFGAFFILLTFLLPHKNFYVLCKMSKNEKCTCSGEHSKHSCCKIIKIQKDINIDLKKPQISFDFENFLIKEIKEEIINFFNLFKEKNLNIHSPPIFLKNLNLLI